MTLIIAFIALSSSLSTIPDDSKTEQAKSNASSLTSAFFGGGLLYTLKYWIDSHRQITEDQFISAVIALTANAIIGARDMYISEGFSDYLTKPIESRELEKQLRRFLPEEKKQYREPEQRRRTAQPAADSDSFTAEEIFGIRDICPGLNVAAGMGNCMDSKEFWLDTLRGFIEADKSEELERAFAAGDTELYRITVHSVKSAAKTIGADMLSEHAKALEFAARDKDTAFVKAHHSELVNEYRRIMNDSDADRAVCDYISGMSDGYAVDLYTDLFVPKFWK